jgi:hypothetical protein
MAYPPYQISWESIQPFLSCYMWTDGQSKAICRDAVNMPKKTLKGNTHISCLQYHLPCAWVHLWTFTGITNTGWSNNLKQKHNYHIYSNIRRKFFPDSSSKNWGLSYNHAQSSKNRANVFVISNTMNLCLGCVVQLLRCVIFFCFIMYHATSCITTSVNRRIAFLGSSTVECF